MQNEPPIRAARRGFTMIELSVVLVIIAVVMGTTIYAGVSFIDGARLQQTKDKEALIEHALFTFRKVNNRLPCPASLTLATTSLNFGIEGPNGANCIDGTAGHATANTITGGYDTIVEGSVPVRTLQLPDNFAFDGWGNRIRYAVTTVYTSNNAIGNTFGSYCVNDTSAASIKILDGTGATNYRTWNAVYALISHGSDGAGAYNGAGTQINISAATDLDEQQNCHCNGGPAYDGKYVEKAVTSTFDDIVDFALRWQMPTATDLPCPNLYVADSANCAIIKVSGSVGTVVAGTWNAGGFAGDGGQATSATLNQPPGIAFDTAGNTYIADQYNNVIRKVTAATGIITTVAGNSALGGGYSGDGGLATSAQLHQPVSVAVDSAGNIYIADLRNSRIRKVTAATGNISTFAGGGGTYPGDGGAATSAGLWFVSGGTVDSAGNFYFSDAGNGLVHKVDAGGIITTVAGNSALGGGYSGDGGTATSAQLNWPEGVVVDSTGNINIADVGNDRIRKVTVATGNISTVAGTGAVGYTGDGGLATAATLNLTAGGPFGLGIALDSAGNIYIPDIGNSAIRKVTAATGIISSVNVDLLNGGGGPTGLAFH